MARNPSTDVQVESTSGASAVIDGVSNNGEAAASAPVTTRLEWELSERVADLDKQLRGMAEAGRIREVELLSLKQELELRMAHCVLLEAVAEERKAQIEWFNQQVDSLRSEAKMERARAKQLEGELRAERQRLSHQLVELIVSRNPRSKGVRIVKKVARLALRGH